jgi:hypothetical protein
LHIFAYFYEWLIVAVCSIMTYYASTQFFPGYMWPSVAIMQHVNLCPSKCCQPNGDHNIALRITSENQSPKLCSTPRLRGREAERTHQATTTHCVTCRWQLRICTLALSIASSQHDNVSCFPYFWLDLIVLFGPVPLFASVESVSTTQTVNF